MGDMYTRLNNKLAADFLYNYVARHYAGTHPAKMASLRFAEGGIYDAPINYEGMTQVLRALRAITCKRFIQILPQHRAQLPNLLLRASRKPCGFTGASVTPEAMGKAAEFIDGYPENVNVAQARDIIWLSFQKELANSMAEKTMAAFFCCGTAFLWCANATAP